MKESRSWSKSVRNISPLGFHLVNPDLTELAPCNLLILVAPDNVAGYWLKNLQHACSGVDTERYTIYPKNEGDAFLESKMKVLIDEHTHTVESYLRDEEQIPRKTLILRMTPTKFSEFLAKPPSIVWPLVVFDEFTAHCGSMGVNATRPACKHLWGISATPTTIVHAFHGKSGKNPFKHLLGNIFLHAETEPIDPMDGPKHFRATPEKCQDILACNLNVSLINAFPPDVLRRTIENVLPMMPAGVDYFATHAPGCSARAALLHKIPAPPNAPTRKIKVIDCSQAGACKLLQKDIGFHDRETDQVGDFFTGQSVLRWRQPTSDHQLLPVWGTDGLIQQLVNAQGTYINTGATDPVTDEWFKNTYQLLDQPPNVLDPASPLTSISDTENYACSLCCCVVNLTQLRGHFWSRHHYDASTNRIKCPGCFQALRMPEPTFKADSATSPDISTALADKISIKSPAYAAVVYTALADAIQNYETRNIVIFCDPPRVTPLLTNICESLRQNAVPVDFHALSDKIPGTGSTKAGQKGGILDWFHKPLEKRPTGEARILLLDATANDQKNEQTHGLNLATTKFMMVMNTRVNNAQQALARALRAAPIQEGVPTKKLRLAILCEPLKHEASSYLQPSAATAPALPPRCSSPTYLSPSKETDDEMKEADIEVDYDSDTFIEE
eukprot:gene24231-29428_t